jgi:hypothetical protein
MRFDPSPHDWRDGSFVLRGSEAPDKFETQGGRFKKLKLRNVGIELSQASSYITS